MRAVQEAQVQKCDLLKWDDQGDTSVWIRQARHADEARRRELQNTMKGLREGGKYYEIYELPVALDVLECYLTFVDATIVEDVKAGDKVLQQPMFRKGMNEAEFRAAFARLPEDLAAEWHTMVRRVNPAWGWTPEDETKN